MDREAQPQRKRIKTSIIGFDEAIGGGIPAGAVCLITGEPGTLKTSLAFSILYNSSMKPGTKCAYLVLEQTKKCLLNQAMSIGLTDKDVLNEISIMDVGSIRKNLHFQKGEESWLSLIKLYINDLVRDEKVEVLAIDSLDVLEALAKFQDKRTDLFHFFGWLRELGLTTIVVSERPLDVRGERHSDEGHLADAIINLGLYPTSDVHVQRRIRCIKMRCTKHETSYFTLVLDDGRFEITRPMSSASMSER